MKISKLGKLAGVVVGNMAMLFVMGGCGFAAQKQSTEQESAASASQNDVNALEYVTLGQYKGVEVYKIMDGDAEPEEIRDNLTNDIMEQVKADAVVEGYPKKMYQVYEESMKTEVEALADEADEEPDEYMEHTYECSFEEYVLDQVQTALILDAIAETEQIALSETEYEDLSVKYIHYMDCDSLAEAEELYGKDVVYNFMLTQKIYDFLIENAVTTEVSYDEYFAL